LVRRIKRGAEQAGALHACGRRWRCSPRFDGQRERIRRWCGAVSGAEAPERVAPARDAIEAPRSMPDSGAWPNGTT